MHRTLLASVVLVAVGVTAAAVGILSPAIKPPNAVAVLLGVLWVGMPFILATGFALLGRRLRGVLIALLVAMVLDAVVGLYLYDRTATNMVTARHAAETAVQPGEDPHHGPGGMRQANADLGSFFTDVFGAIVLAAVPPAQLVAVAVAAGVGALVSRSRPAPAG